MTSHLILF